MSELAKALAKAQASFPAIERSKTVSVKTKTGGTYTFAYAPLDAITHAVAGPLAANDLAYSQLLSNIDGAAALRTVLMHSSGETIEDVCPLPINGGVSAQEFGSLVTYMRRYALVALLGIATEEDDDGNAASGNSVNGEAGGQATTPTNAFKPSELVIHWGDHKGKKLGDITKGQLWWFAEKWTLQETPSEYDHLLKAAAVALHAGSDEPIHPDPVAGVPFA